MADVELLTHARLRRMTKEALSAHAAELEGEVARLEAGRWGVQRVAESVKTAVKKAGSGIHDATQAYSRTKSRAEFEKAKKRVKELGGTVSDEKDGYFEYRRLGDDNYRFIHRYVVKVTADNGEHVKVKIFINNVLVDTKFMKGDDVPTPAATQYARVVSTGSDGNTREWG